MAELQRPDNPDEVPPRQAALPAVPTEPPAGNAADQLDPVARREFEEFRRFQEFQRYKAAHPDGAPPEPPAPLWRRILRNKFVRKLLMLLILLFVALTFVECAFGGRGSGSGAGGESPGFGTGGSVRPNSPRETVRTVYHYIGHHEAGDQRPCSFFTTGAAIQFAEAHGTADCATAVTELAGQVTDAEAYASPEIDSQTNQVDGDRTEVSSCDSISVRGGPALGDFQLSRHPDGGWEITGYATTEACESTAPPSEEADPGVTARPSETVRLLHTYVLFGPASNACALFSPEAGADFAANFGASDCASAVQELGADAEIGYRNPGFPDSAQQRSEPVVTISSCEMTVEDGPRLGLLELTYQEDSQSWLITGHEAETCGG
ncbi:hypothetical protein [Actinoalloteichus hymeniacidonis]|uniref:hypothetical protein n=1 Tax=Actinoalloteichus hymeniacidonis TaxID=340345 RepID=UPI0012F7A5AA|nr:hypothetical protein [Actinoalloteichus hymeniacidonis]MBB5910583.1 hypothetical protein [Actinoalloteichus hymeniacidonis]